MFYQVLLRCLPGEKPQQVVHSFMKHHLGVLSFMGDRFVRPMEIQYLSKWDEVCFTLVAEQLNPAERALLIGHLNTNLNRGNLIWFREIVDAS